MFRKCIYLMIINMQYILELNIQWWKLLIIVFSVCWQQLRRLWWNRDHKLPWKEVTLNYGIFLLIYKLLFPSNCQFVSLYCTMVMQFLAKLLELFKILHSHDTWEIIFSLWYLLYLNFLITIIKLHCLAEG